MGDFAFDADTQVSPGSDGEFTAGLTSRWDGTNGAVNGGYMLAICARALGLVMPFPDPIVISGFFLRPGTPGMAAVRTSLLRSGRTTAFGEASLACDGKQVVSATAAFAEIGSRSRTEPLFVNGTPPRLPPPAECVALPAGPFGRASIHERVEFRFAELPGWLRGQPSGHPASAFWTRFADGRDADLLALPLLADASAPSVVELGATSTTIQLTVHLRARPAPGWLACRAVTRFVSGGYHEEDFEIWDSAGTLVAQSRQLAQILR
jgi:acyl-coenzyme A thioesterase PaaI-like protein